jgi:hypothetical protein
MTAKLNSELPHSCLAIPKYALDLTHWPFLVDRQHANPTTIFADQRVAATSFIGGADQLEISFRRPIERQIQIAREDLPAGPIVEFNDMAFRMVSNFHGDQHRLVALALQRTSGPQRSIHVHRRFRCDKSKDVLGDSLSGLD